MNSNWSYSPETPNLGRIWRFLEPCDLEIWLMTLKNNRAPLLSNIKLYASFHHHMWIQTGVTVRKRLSWVVTSVTLTFDFWPWPFAWTLLWSLVITPENLMMIPWSGRSSTPNVEGLPDLADLPDLVIPDVDKTALWLGDCGVLVGQAHTHPITVNQLWTGQWLGALVTQLTSRMK